MKASGKDRMSTSSISLALLGLIGCAGFASPADANHVQPIRIAVEAILKAHQDFSPGAGQFKPPMNSVTTLSNIVLREPSTEAAHAARVWLVSVELTSGHVVGNPANRAKAQRLLQHLQPVLELPKPCWQLTAARFLRLRVLAIAGDYSKAVGLIHEAELDIQAHDYTTSVEMGDWLKLVRIGPGDLLPELRMLALILCALNDDVKGALKYAEQIKTQAPEFARKRRVDQLIEHFKADKNPYRP